MVPVPPANSLLTVRYRAGSDSHGNALYLCDCICGGSKTVPASNIRNGSVISCGCQRFKSKHGACTKENNRSTSEYKTWVQMKARCQDEGHPDYTGYGGRGITVCGRWQEFGPFLVDMGPRPSGGMLERRNNDGNYEPDNCYWATLKKQCNNRRSNRKLTAFGRTQTLTEWAEENGLSRNTLTWRLNQGWSESDALNTPAKQPKA